jgi:hypothetical protein
LKKSSGAGSEPFERLQLPQFARKTCSILGVETYFGLALSTGSLFSTFWPIPAVTPPIFRLVACLPGSKSGCRPLGIGPSFSDQPIARVPDHCNGGIR